MAPSDPSDRISVRSAQEVYDAHVAALALNDLDAVVADYDPDAVLGSNQGVGRGHAYIREVFGAFLGAGSDLEPQTTVHVEGDVVFVTWSGTAGGVLLAGADTFVVENGLIAVHTGFFSPAASG